MDNHSRNQIDLMKIKPRRVKSRSTKKQYKLVLKKTEYNRGISPKDSKNGRLVRWKSLDLRNHKKEDFQLEKIRKKKIELEIIKKGVKRGHGSKNNTIIYGTQPNQHYYLSKKKNIKNDRNKVKFHKVHLSVQTRLYNESLTTRTHRIHSIDEKQVDDGRAKTKLLNRIMFNNKFKKKLKMLFRTKKKKLENLKTTTLNTKTNNMPYNKYLVQRIKQFKLNQQKIREKAKEDIKILKKSLILKSIKQKSNSLKLPIIKVNSQNDRSPRKQGITLFKDIEKLEDILKGDMEVRFSIIKKSIIENRLSQRQSSLKSRLYS